MYLLSLLMVNASLLNKYSFFSFIDTKLYNDKYTSIPDLDNVFSFILLSKHLLGSSCSPRDAPDPSCSAQAAGTAECRDAGEARRRWRWPLAV